MAGVIDLGRVIGPEGPQGLPGAEGPQGNPGPQGVPGSAGVTPNLQVGTVTTLPPDQNATVTRAAGSPDSAPVFDFGIPKGPPAENPGDMRAAVYDPQGKGEDVFAYARQQVTENTFTRPETLSTQTAALYGLGEGAVPDEVLAKVAFVTQYMWQKMSGHFKIALGTSASQQTSTSGNTTPTQTSYYTDTFTIDPLTGLATYGTLTTLAISYNTYTDLSALRGMFWSRSSDANSWLVGNGIFYSDSNATYSRSGTYQTYMQGSPVSVAGPTESVIVLDPNKDAYPSPYGILDGNIYHSMGKIRDIAINSFVTGSYTGTGSNTTQTINLGFIPEVLFVFPAFAMDRGVPVMVTPELSTVGAPYITLTGASFAVKGYLNLVSTDNYGNYVNPYRYIAWRRV